MRSLSRWIGFVIAPLLLGAHTGAAHAAAGDLATVVAPLSNEVSFSATGLVSRFGFTVSVTNTGLNTINSVKFLGRVSTSGGAQAIVDGASCPVVTSTAIECSIGQLTSGASYPTFTVFFQAPVASPGLTAVAFDGTLQYAEGTRDSKSKPPNSTTPSWGPVNVQLAASDGFNVSSIAPKSGGRFFTGTGVTSTADVFTTDITVPASDTYSIVSVEESANTENCVNFNACFDSTVSIPERVFGANLAILLRQDASNIKPGIKIEKVLVYYDGVKVLDCPAPPIVITNGVPCIAKRVYYKSASVTGWTPELDGDFEWLIFNDRNGSYRLP